MFREVNPHRIGMTDAEREQHISGRGISTPGKGSTTTGHLNLTRSLADIYDIPLVHIGSKGQPTYKWLLKRPPDA